MLTADLDLKSFASHHRLQKKVMGEGRYIVHMRKE
jgi:hypothetical protein